MQTPVRRFRVLGGLTLALFAIPVLAHAASVDALKLRCQRALVKGSSGVVRTEAIVLQRCADAIARGSLPPGTDCIAEPRTHAKRVRVAAKMRATIERACGGADRRCGTPDDDDAFTLAELGVPVTCVDFEEIGCDFAVADCSDLANCFLCLGSAATHQAVDFLYGLRAVASGAALACQRAIGRETINYLTAKDRILQRCWDMRLKGRHADRCPDHLAPARSTAARAAAKIARAETRKIARICRACGGTDGQCDDAVSPINPASPRRAAAAAATISRLPRSGRAPSVRT